MVTYGDTITTTKPHHFNGFFGFKSPLSHSGIIEIVPHPRRVAGTISPVWARKTAGRHRSRRPHLSEETAKAMFQYWACFSAGETALFPERLTPLVPETSLFHVMRNSPQSGTELISASVDALSKRLPLGWNVKRLEEFQLIQSNTRRPPDAILEVRGPDGKSAKVFVEVKQRLEPRNVLRLVELIRACSADATLVVAPFIGTRTRELLREGRCGYADATGNFLLSLSEPALFVEISGATKDPNPLQQPLRSLKGRAAGRAARAMCDLRPPLRVRKLALRAKLPPATISRVAGLLEREMLIERDAKGIILNVSWERTIRRWAEDYSFAKSNRVRTFLDPRGIPALRQKLAQASWKNAVTGSLAASMVAPVAAPRLAQIYVKDAGAAADALELRPAEAGANAMLVEPFDDVVFDRTTRREGIECAALPQVAVDLLTGPGLGPKEADALLTWMAENIDVWQA